MRSLSALDVIEIWDRLQGLGNPEKALALLDASLPEKRGEELSDLTIGQRDALLLILRKATLGPILQAYVECPECSEKLEFPADIDQILTSGAPEPEGSEFGLKSGDVEVRYRLPNGDDAVAASQSPDLETARRLLFARCLVFARREGQDISPDALPESVVADVAEHMSQQDPHADVQFSLACPTCGHSWLTLLDIAPFLWTELTAVMQRLLYDVDAIARRYGWSERDILSISATRRQMYLDMVV